MRFDTSLKAMQASQLGIQTASHNIANANTPGFSRQNVRLAASTAHDVSSIQIGQGVDSKGVVKNTNNFMEQHVIKSSQDVGFVTETKNVLDQLETLFLPGEGDIFSQFGKFTSDLNALSAAPADVGTREVFVDSASNVANSIKEQSLKFSQIMEQIHQSMEKQVELVNETLEKIANFNKQITQDQGFANDLKDQRNQAVKELSNLANVAISNDSKGNIHVALNNHQLVSGSIHTPLELSQVTATTQEISLSGTNIKLNVTGGSIGGLLEAQNNILPEQQGRLDQFASSLIQKVNSIHSTGIPLAGGVDSLTSENSVSDPLASLQGEGAVQNNGDLTIRVRDIATGNIQDNIVSINPATDSLTDVANNINAISNLNANVNAQGQLEISSAAGNDFSFATDTSDTLTGLGLNTLFSGTNAKDIGVVARIEQNVDNLALAKTSAANDNSNARVLLDNIQNIAQGDLGNVSYSEFMQNTISQLGESAASNDRSLSFNESVLQSAENLRESFSGVSVDEELVNLNKFQRSFQASARIFKAVDEMMQTVINL